jgi:subtilase family serine protease
MIFKVHLAAAALFLAGFSAVTTGTAAAQAAPVDEGNGLAGLVRIGEKLQVSPSLEPIEGVRGSLASPVDAAWTTFQLDHGAWSAQIDGRSGRIESAEGPGIPWIPGRGNKLTAADLADFGEAAVKGAPDLKLLESIARRFVATNGALFGLDGKDLVLSLGRSGAVSDYLWFVDFNVTRAGVPIEGARVVFRVNHGNLIQFGMENVPPADVAMPPIKITREQAFATVSDYVGGIVRGQDQILDAGSLHLLPTVERDSRFAAGYALGKGYGLASVWEVKFHREGALGTWRARVDATSGELLEFLDVNDYIQSQISGGVILGASTSGDTVRAMPYADFGTAGVFATSAGLFTYPGTPVTSMLKGQYVTIVDTCGAVSQTSSSSGDIAFGSSAPDVDCKTPSPTSSAGDTRASRTQFYWLNRIKEVGRGWLPSNTWLQGNLTAEVNITPSTCNAFWNGSRVRFFNAAAPCGNTGQLPGISLHEFGHGLDANDGNGSSPDNGTSEAYGDINSSLALHQSCIGPGWSSNKCTGYGNACNTCKGVREVDWAQHAANVASTVANFTQTTCPFHATYIGPCGKDAMARGVTANQREGHCESLIASESVWDLAARDLPSSWTTIDRLWYMSRSTATQSFTCNTISGGWTSNGCNVGSLWKVFRAADDDNGNLNDGTPHSAALFAAFNRHGIACLSDTGKDVSFRGCTQPSVPTMALTQGNNSATVGWSNSGSGVVYDVFRNESGCGAGFIRIANDVGGFSFVDTGTANNTTYYYQVIAQPTGNEACSSTPSTCQSYRSMADLTPTAITYTPTNPVAGNVIAFDSGVKNQTLVDSGQFNIKWFVDGVQVGYGLHVAVAGNTTMLNGNSSFNWTATAGTHTIQFSVDVDNGVVETNEGNNSTSITITVPTALPDLTPTSITYTPSSPVAGNVIAFDSGVKNQTSVASGTFNVKWFIDGVQVGYGGHTAVPGNTTVLNGNSSFNWTSTQGTHAIQFSVDVDNGVVETNESNNSVIISVTVAPPRPDLAPTAITFTPASPEAGDVIAFDSGVSNSTSVASGAFNVKWFIDGVQLGYGGHTGIPANTTVLNGNSALNWTATQGTHTVQFSVDVDNQVAETNEGNNSTSRSVTVVAPRPDLTPTAINLNSADLVRGRAVLFDSGVQNLKPVASANFNIKWFVDGVQVGYGLHTGVPGNTTVLNGNSSFTWTAVAGTHTLTFTLDVDAQVAESNEGNNSRAVTVTVP